MLRILTVGNGSDGGGRSNSYPLSGFKTVVVLCDDDSKIPVRMFMREYTEILDGRCNIEDCKLTSFGTLTGIKGDYIFWRVKSLSWLLLVRGNSWLNSTFLLRVHNLVSRSQLGFPNGCSWIRFHSSYPVEDALQLNGKPLEVPESNFEWQRLISFLLSWTWVVMVKVHGAGTKVMDEIRVN